MPSRRTAPKFGNALVLCLSIATPNTAHAASLDYDLTFVTHRQNLWSSGEAFQITDSRFLGIDWNESLQNSFFFDSVGVNAHTSGQIGFQSDFQMHGGAISALVPIDISFVVPDMPVRPGEVVTLGTDFSFRTDAAFWTNSPIGSYDLDLMTNVSGYVDISPGRFLDIDTFRFQDVHNLITLDHTGFDVAIDPWARLRN